MPIHCMDIFALGRLLERVYPEGTPAALDKYVGKMLLADPAKRPTASQYLRCAFLRRRSVKDLAALEVCGCHMDAIDDAALGVSKYCTVYMQDIFVCFLEVCY